MPQIRPNTRFRAVRGGPKRLDFPPAERYNPWCALSGARGAGQGARHRGSANLAIYELVIRTQFAAAHRLREYAGNCERLHGHNWKVDVVLQAEGLDRLGMVIDFREAKRRIDAILGRLDHQYLNDVEPFGELNPTTENIARTLFDALAAQLPAGVAIAKVTVWESDLCGASYSRTP